VRYEHLGGGVSYAAPLEAVKQRMRIREKENAAHPWFLGWRNEVDNLLIPRYQQSRA